MSIKNLLLLILLNFVISTVVVEVSFKVRKVITFNELSQWFCVERLEARQMMWWDMQYVYTDFLRLHPNDNHLKKDMGWIKNQYNDVSKDISNKKYCSTFGHSHFWFSNQDIRCLEYNCQEEDK